MKVIVAARHHRLLERATLVYISLPFLIFALGWLRPLVGVPVAAVTLAGLYRAQRPLAGRPCEVARSDLRMVVALVLAVCAVAFVMLYSGTVGYAFQFGGHYRNNSFIADMIQYPWPLGFEDVANHRGRGVLAFYLANAISPALVGTLLGSVSAFHFQFVRQPAKNEAAPRRPGRPEPRRQQPGVRRAHRARSTARRQTCCTRRERS